jgi:hypothetical protein
MMGCQTTTDSAETSAIQSTAPDQRPDFCAMFDPIWWSRNDTPDTQRQVKVFNAIWTDSCGTVGGFDKPVSKEK